MGLGYSVQVRVAPLKLQSSLAKFFFLIWLELETFLGRGGLVAGSTENKANSALLELELAIN
jgi:hypothetical protein